MKSNEKLKSAQEAHNDNLTTENSADRMTKLVKIMRQLSEIADNITLYKASRDDDEAQRDNIEVDVDRALNGLNDAAFHVAQLAGYELLQSVYYRAYVEQSTTEEREHDGSSTNTGYGFKDHMDAIRAADEERRRAVYPDDLHVWGVRTERDTRDFVFFNLLCRIDEALYPSLEDVYLRRIQSNIFRSAFK